MNLERWHTLTLAQQFGNIGSEISRIHSWKARKDADAAEQAFFRALDCIDATLADTRWRGRQKEIVRLREVLADSVQGGEVYAVPLEHLLQYCTHFALIARG
ncbi:MAG: hypothetical protein Q7S16_02160 [bacterium]|nr:hypothetical protein [bacterium]